MGIARWWNLDTNETMVFHRSNYRKPGRWSIIINLLKSDHSNRMHRHYKVWKLGVTKCDNFVGYKVCHKWVRKCDRLNGLQWTSVITTCVKVDYKVWQGLLSVAAHRQHKFSQICLNGMSSTSLEVTRFKFFQYYFEYFKTKYQHRY